jgi:hypothetical protein
MPLRAEHQPRPSEQQRQETSDPDDGERRDGGRHAAGVTLCTSLCTCQAFPSARSAASVGVSGPTGCDVRTSSRSGRASTPDRRWQEPPDTGSRDLPGRDSTSAGRRDPVRSAATAAPYQPHSAANRVHFDACDRARRTATHPWTEPGRETAVVRNAPRRSVIRSPPPPRMGAARPVSVRSGDCSPTAVRSWSGLLLTFGRRMTSAPEWR